MTHLWKVAGRRVVVGILELPDASVDGALAGLPIVKEMGAGVKTEVLPIYDYRVRRGSEGGCGRLGLAAPERQVEVPARLLLVLEVPPLTPVAAVLAFHRPLEHQAVAQRAAGGVGGMRAGAQVVVGAAHVEPPPVCPGAPA